jgi:hypothetical protein
MNLLGQLQAAASNVVAKPVRKSGQEKRSATFKAKRYALWRGIFDTLGWDKVSTPRVAALRGQSNIVALEGLYRLEKEGLVKRDGTERGSGSRRCILWTWTGERA